MQQWVPGPDLGYTALQQERTKTFEEIDSAAVHSSQVEPPHFCDDDDKTISMTSSAAMFRTLACAKHID
jgi:hypothetical protein